MIITDTKRKINTIADIWNNYILEYKFCNSRIKFTEDVQSNYFGEILNCFSDTDNIIEINSKVDSEAGMFASAISFLQAVYIQQDFIEELLFIFKCNITKGDLKQDPDYSINREIRNELVGHPIRKVADRSSVLSSTLFHFRYSNNENIAYLRYHKDNDYKQELIAYSKAKIVERHYTFLNRYLDKILEKLNTILGQFSKKLVEIENVIENSSLPSVLKVVSNYYEHFYTVNYLFKPIYLTTIETKVKEHIRYKNAFDYFFQTLNECLKEDKRLISEYKTPTKASKSPILPKKIIIKGVDKNKISFTYEMSKLSSRRSFQDFQFFSALLKTKCKNKKAVVTELDNMENHYNDDIEYYSSYCLIRRILKY